jgi:hypothetical protein
MQRSQTASFSSDRDKVPTSSRAYTLGNVADYFESLMNEETSTEAPTALPESSTPTIEQGAE